MSAKKEDSYEKFFNNVLEHTVDRTSRSVPGFFHGSGSAGCVEDSSSHEAPKSQDQATT